MVKIEDEEIIKQLRELTDEDGVIRNLTTRNNALYQALCYRLKNEKNENGDTKYSDMKSLIEDWTGLVYDNSKGKIKYETLKKQLMEFADSDGVIKGLQAKNKDVGFYQKIFYHFKRNQKDENGELKYPDMKSFIEDLTGLTYDDSGRKISDETLAKELMKFKGPTGNIENFSSSNPRLYNTLVGRAINDKAVFIKNEIDRDPKYLDFIKNVPPVEFMKSNIKDLTGLIYIGEKSQVVNWINENCIDPNKRLPDGRVCIDSLREIRDGPNLFSSLGNAKNLSYYAFATQNGWYLSEGWIDIDAIAYAKYMLHSDESRACKGICPANGLTWKDWSQVYYENKKLYSLVYGIKNSFPEYANGKLGDMLYSWGILYYGSNPTNKIKITPEDAINLAKEAMGKSSDNLLTANNRAYNLIHRDAKKEYKSVDKWAEENGLPYDNLRNLDPAKSRLTSLRYNNEEELLEFERIKEEPLYKYFCKETAELNERSRVWREQQSGGQ